MARYSARAVDSSARACCRCPVRPYRVPRPCGQQFHRPFQVGEQHSDLLEITLQGCFGRENLFGDMGGHVWQVGWRWSWNGRWRRPSSPSPDQDAPLLVDRQSLRLDDFRFEVVEIRVIQAKPALQGVVGDAALALEELEDLGQECIKGHRRPSTCPCGLSDIVPTVTLSCRACAGATCPIWMCIAGDIHGFPLALGALYHKSLRGFAIACEVNTPRVCAALGAAREKK